MNNRIRLGSCSAAVFDFDGTIIRTDSTRAFLGFLLRKYPSAAVDLAHLAIITPACLAGALPRERVKQLTVRAIRHVPEQSRTSFFKSFHDLYLVRRYLAGAIEETLWHRRQGRVLVLASASLDVYLVHVARKLNFDALICTESVLGTELRLAGPNCRGEQKARRLAALNDYDIDWSRSWVYSNSLSDLPSFDLCGNPVAANPTNALRRQARRRGWRILDW